MAFCTIVALLLFPQLSLKSLFIEPYFIFEDRTSYGPWLQAVLWVPWSIIIDYVSLFKTRVILRMFARVSAKKSMALGMLIMDYVIYTALFRFGYFLTFATWIFLGMRFGSRPEKLELWFAPSASGRSPPGSDLSYFDVIKAVYETYLKDLFSDVIWHEMFLSLQSLKGIIFWSGFAPSLWMWLYVAALFVTRGLLRSEKIVNWLRWFLDVEKNPFRSIGAVAATLAFIVSVAIILVSAEVSRISAAT
jgi:hypothetical protein